MKSNIKINILVFLLSSLLIIFHIKIKKPLDPQESKNMMAGFNHGLNMIGTEVAPFKITLLDGSEYNYPNPNRKKIVILNFWATWCGPCIEEIPELNKFASQISDKPVDFIGINAAENEDLVRAFVEKYKLIYPVGIDRNTLLTQFNIRAYPTTVLIGFDGKIKLYEPGSILNADVSLIPLINEEINNQKAVSKPQELAR